VSDKSAAAPCRLAPPVTSVEKHGVVVAVEQLAAEVGARILDYGGNAADAAVAAAFAQTVVNPIESSIFGSLSGLFHDGSTRATATVASLGSVPRDACRDGNEPTAYGGALVPGFVRGAAEAWRRFGSGKVSWRQLVEPAIGLAAEGFIVYPHLYRTWMPKTQLVHGVLEGSDGPRSLSSTPECARVYLKQDGTVHRIGDRLILADCAETLQRIADEGPDEPYEGRTAAAIIADRQAHDGTMSADDLRRYRPDVAEPVRGTFREHDALTVPCHHIAETMVRMLQAFDDLEIGTFDRNSPPYFARLARAMQQTLGRAHATGALDGEVVATAATHVAVVDGDGNIALISQSSGRPTGFVTPGLGFRYMLGADRGGSRWCDGGDSILLVDARGAALGLGSPGGHRMATAAAQVVANLVYFGADLGAAVGAERIHVVPPRSVVVEPHFDPVTQLELARAGYEVDLEWPTARVQVVQRRADGTIAGASDPRGGQGLATAGTAS
jgi:gamma-glutamyltranspeptidase/glutathione hydrolase